MKHEFLQSSTPDTTLAVCWWNTNRTTILSVGSSIQSSPKKSSVVGTVVSNKPNKPNKPRTSTLFLVSFLFLPVAPRIAVSGPGLGVGRETATELNDKKGGGTSHVSSQPLRPPPGSWPDWANRIDSSFVLESYKRYMELGPSVSEFQDSDAFNQHACRFGALWGWVECSRSDNGSSY